MASVDQVELTLHQAEGTFSSELQAQNQLKGALAIVYDAVMSRRKVQPAAQERLMIKLVELSVKTESMTILKESLAVFRNVSQNMSPSSFQKVIEELRTQAEEQVKSLAADASSDLQDLEAEDQPDQVLCVSVGPAEVRSARKSALKFLWESYKVSLDLLKANGKMVNVYDITAQHALKFCRTHKRVVECRHFCETLHSHLQNALRTFKMPGTGAQLSYLHDFNDDETVVHLINVRLSALETCLDLNLHQEGFHVADDLHSLMTMRKASLQHLFIYWQGLARIFLKAEQPLFHALSLHNVLYHVRKGKKELTAEQNSDISSAVVLATLAVPYYSIDKRSLNPSLLAKLTSMMSASSLPSREVLVQLLMTRNILEVASPDVKEIFNLLETEFSPLNLPARLHPLLQKLREREDLGPYAPSLEKNLVLKVLGQISACYQTIRLDTLAHLFNFIPFPKLERLILLFAAHSNLKVVIDYRTKTLRFKETLDALGPGVSLGHLMQSIQEASACISLQDLVREQQETVKSLWGKVREEHSEMLLAQKQKQDDADRVQKERLSDLQKREEEMKKQEVSVRRKDETEHEERMKQKAISQRIEKLNQQKREIYLEEIYSYLEKIESAHFEAKSARLGGKKVFKMTPEELLQFHPEEFSKLYHKLLEESKSEQNSELKSEQTKFEHFERAKREIEASILRERWAEQEDVEKEEMKSEHLRRYQQDRALRDLVRSLADTRDQYITRETELAKDPFQEAMRQWEEKAIESAKEKIMKRATERLELEKEEEQKAEIRRKEEEKRPKFRRAEERPGKEEEKHPDIWRKEPAIREEPKPFASRPAAPVHFTNTKKDTQGLPLKREPDHQIKPQPVQEPKRIIEEVKAPATVPARPEEAKKRRMFGNSKKEGAMTEEHKKAYKHTVVKGDDDWVTQAK